MCFNLLPCFFRPSWEGGEYKGDEESRLQVLRKVVELDADFVDVELQVSAHFSFTCFGNNLKASIHTLKTFCLL